MNALQRLSLCAVDAHHQNGIVERAIKTLTLISQTLLLHAQRHWPEYITTMLWPLALKAAQDRMNQLTVDLDGKTPEMKFSDVASATIRLCNCHTWGCPCYILDSRLQTNPKGVPKWEPQAQLGIYVGRSPHHAGNVALVLNPHTGLISPQFHVVFDDDFSKVPHLRRGTVPPNWAELVRHLSEKTTSEFFDLTKTWFQSQSDETAGKIITSQNKGAGIDNAIPSNEGAALDSSSTSITSSTPMPHQNEGDLSTIQDHEGEVNITMPTMIDLETAGLR
ncbi:hypothetical protein ACHAXS_001279 [Conticribra weissflogii]